MTCCKCCTHCLTDSLLKWSRLCFLLFPLLVQIRIHVPNAALDWVATLSTHQTCKQFVFVSFYICIFRWLSYSYLTDAGLDRMHISQEISLPNKLQLGKDGGTKSDEFSGKFQKGGKGGGSFSIQKFMLQTLDLYKAFFSEKKLRIDPAFKLEASSDMII